MSGPRAATRYLNNHQGEQSSGCGLCARSKGAPRSLPQPQACRRRQDTIASLTAHQADLVPPQIDARHELRGQSGCIVLGHANGGPRVNGRMCQPRPDKLNWESRTKLAMEIESPFGHRVPFKS
jgi:hypothetical protein